MIIDTHTHLYLPEFAPMPEQAVDRAVEAGVGLMIFPNVDCSTVEPMMELHGKRPEATRVAMGLHPTEVNANPEPLQRIEAFLRDNPGDFVAVGEIGMDLYWSREFVEQQKEAFRKQLLLASELNLPVIIHCREALDEVLEVIDSLHAVPQGVFHSFGGTVEDVEKIRRRGNFYFGINGIITFKNSRLRDVVRHIGLDHILLETDSPYLAPVPHRGKRNESAFIVHTAAYLADVLNVPLEEIKRKTTVNAERLFRIA